ncbi:RHS repeat-associated core domain-containing protein [Pigmentibacter sp. JX0631]|uniref:RHS repeat-associated core domain-containing protein n=1 Tax=Pigmentibacter sp. JX0631 TaxID=2976982 RepID=UPI0024693F43|nr:RHS repeat-associated core domain-containing protein [Pigmentibacter sp. JX0631]WGL61380.1 RHS repeat-associated core domain-containing protein [Pigmentibacter sp. JX0631]
MKNTKLKRILAIFCIILTSFLQFQSYVYAINISKVTEVIYGNDTKISRSKALAQSQNTGSSSSNALNTNNLSDANNFKDLTKNVDPRTGALNISYNIGNISGPGYESPSIDLKIVYSSLANNSDRFGLGKGWFWNLTYFDSKTSMLYLSNGSSYKLDLGKSVLKYYKLKDLVVNVNQNSIVLKYKDGKTEIIDKVYGNLQSITNLEGLVVNFSYTNSNYLEKIYYKSSLTNSEINSLEVSYIGNALVEIKVNNGNNSIVTKVEKSANKNLLTSLTNPLKQSMSFQYNSEKEDDFSTDYLVTKINYPTGTSVLINYLKGGLNSSKKGISFPAVSKINTTFLSITKNVEGISTLNDSISYEYNQDVSNYLGKGFNGYKEGEDALFQTPNSYTYSTIEIKNAPNHEKIRTIRNYNHYHQILTETVKQNDEIVKIKEFSYQDWENKNFDSLSASYNLPVEIKTTYKSSLGKRVENYKYQYDEYGNILQIIEPTGIIKNYKYFAKEKTNSDFVFLLEREVTSSNNDKRSIVTEYSYEDFSNNIGLNKQRLKAKITRTSDFVCKSNDSECGKVIKTELMSYSKNIGNVNSIVKPFSLPLYVKTFAGNNGKCKINIKNTNYSVQNNYTLTENYYYNNSLQLLAKESSKVNIFSKKETEKTDLNGINVKYQYDDLGRMVKEEIKPNITGNSLITYFSYFLNDSTYGLGYGSSVVMFKNPNGYSGYTVYDSLGKEIQLYNSTGSSGNYSLIKTNSYSNEGFKDSETIFESDLNGNISALKKQIYYDFFGREKNIVLPSGETQVSMVDDGLNTRETYVIARNGEYSPIKIEYLDLNYKPVKTEILDGSRNLFSKSINKYDDFGNMIQSIDVNGNSIQYVYNSFNQKIKEIFKDGRSIVYNYDPLFTDKLSNMSVISNDGKIFNLGNREFDSIGMLISEKDAFNKEIKYSYDIYGNLISKTNKSGKIIKYSYNGFNKVVKTEVVGEDSKYSSSFIYDSLTQNLTKMLDSNGETNYIYYLDGKIKQISYINNKSISYKYSQTGLLLSIKDINNLISNYYYDTFSNKLNKAEFISSNGNSETEEFLYDNFGRLKTKIMANNIQVDYTYNSMSLLSNMKYSNSNEIILSYDYQYTVNLNISSRIRKSSSSDKYDANEQYSYDFMNNLSNYNCDGSLCPKDQTGNQISSEDYTFDSLNNIKTVNIKYKNNENNFLSYEYNKQDGIRLDSLKVSGSKNYIGNFDYDADGNMIKDADGNIMKYSPFQRLISFTDKIGNSTSYNYNGLGELYSQIDPSGNKSFYYFNGNRLINESKNAEVTSYLQINGYVVGKNIDSKFQFYLLDQARSIVKIYDNGKLLSDNYVYTPYGERSNLSNSSEKKLETIGFNGETTDQNSGYQFLGKGYRAYNPSLGRFMQYDSNSPYGKGGFNGYIFAENNPIMKFDPTGESSSNIVFGLGIGFSILGIIFSIVTLGTTLAPAIAGTAALTATDIAVSAASVAGLASSAIGMTGQIYGRKSANAAEAGNKADADHYGNISHILGWTGFALGMAASFTGVGLDIAALRAGPTAATDGVVSLTAKAKLPSNYLPEMYNVFKPIVNSSVLTGVKKVSGYISDLAWAGGKGFGEVARNYSKEGNKEKADYYSKISSEIFWLLMGAGGVSTAVTILRKPGDTMDYLNKMRNNETVK